MLMQGVGFFSGSVNLAAFAKDFNVNILESVMDKNWDEHYKKILALKKMATDFLQDKETPKIEAERDLIAYMCAHAAWGICARKRKAGYEEALEYIGLAKIIAEERLAVLGYIQYVESTVHRGSDKFDLCLQSAVASVQSFDKQVASSGKSHAYNQRGLAYLRLQQLEAAAGSFEAALAEIEEKEISAIISPLDLKFNATALLLSAEGDPLPRTLMNLAQVYLKLNVYGKAVEMIKRAIDLALQQSTVNPLDIAYKNNVLAECLIGKAKQLSSEAAEQHALYQEAEKVLQAAYGLYESHLKEPNQNKLLVVINLIEVNQLQLKARGEFSHYSELADKMCNDLKLDASHPLLNRVRVLCDAASFAPRK